MKKILLRLRYMLLLFWLVQSLGAFASGNGKQPKEDKPDKPRKTVGLPTHSISLENGMPSNTASKSMMLQNAQLSNALDKAVAQMGDVMSLMDYSEFPAERAEVLVDASTNNDRAEAEALFDEITKGNRYIKSINNGAVLALPQGIRWGDVDEAGNSKGGNSITVGIASAIFKPEYTVLKMYVKIEIETPAGGGNVASSPKKTLFFGSDNIKLSQDGGFIGDTRLVLLGDYKIPFGKYDFIMRGGLNKSTGAFADFTYVSIDCNGFRELKVSGSLQFPTNVLVKIDPITGVVETGKNVIGEIAATVYDINDLRFDVSLPAFALASAPTWGFVVQGATFDFSTRTNSPGTVFPEKYAADYFPPESDGSLAINTWRGVFVKNLEVLLPKEFRKKVDKNKTIFARQKITAQNLLIDERGISGSFSKEPVIQLNEGDASGWDFSVDKIRVDFETNKLVGGAFNGIIQLPISQDATAQLAYSGEIAPVGDMALTVTLKDGISFDAFKGYIKLTEGTSVKFETKNGYFIPTATINGEMGIYVKNIKDAPAQPARPAQPEIPATATTPSTPAVPATLAKPAVVGGEKATTVAEKEDATVQIPSITVQGLVLTGDPTKPWISLAYAGYEKEMKLSFFPASITKLALAVNQNECSLVLGVKVAIMKDNFAATTVLKLNGAVTPDKKIVVGSPAITVEKIKLEKVDLGAFIIDGEAEIKENRVEKGWGGSLAFTLKDPNMKIASATAAFGYNKTENYRYWFIGASFGNSQWASDNDKPKVGVFQIGHITFAAYSNCIPKGIISANDNLSASVVAKKGIIGFKGAVGLKTPALSGEAGLEVAISDTWGVKRISFVGNAELNAKPSASNVANVEKNQKEQTGETNINKSTDKAVADKKAEAPSKAFAIRLNILRDFDQGIFHGECDFYVNIGVMKGNQPNGLAGKIVSHVETKANNPKYPGKNMWYFHVGNPDSRITVGATLMGNTFKTGFYFMTGFGLPAAPSMPAFYQKALGYKSTKYQKPNYGDLASGTFGTAFGAELYYQQRREMGMGVVYAYYSFKFGLGFDFITRDCGAGSCIPTSANTTWLSSAQAYAYLEGSAGVGVKVWLFRGEVEIINAGVGALISANFPKPSGGCANLIVWYKIWKYRGSFDVEYKFGKECDNCAGQSIGCPRDSYN